MAIFIFVGTAQGRNIINEAEFARSGTRKYTSILALWLWAYNSFKLSATAISLLDPIKTFGKNSKFNNKLCSVLPALFGYLPWITALLVMGLSKEIPDLKLIALLALAFWLFIIYLLLRSNLEIRLGTSVISRMQLHILSGFIFYLYIHFNRPFNKWLNKLLNKERIDITRAGSKKIDYKTHWQLHVNAEQIINWGAHSLLFFLIAIFPIFFGKIFGPIGLIFIALSSYAVLGTMFIYMKEWFGFPILPVFLIAVLIFTSVSDNNVAGKVQQLGKDDREILTENFAKWIRERAVNEDSIQVNLVAAEGGGLRSAFWTYAVLRKLQLENSNFYKELYAISSVSGGSVGSALFCTEQFTGLTPSLSEAPIINYDNLSPMIAALFFRELIQSVLPFDIESLDRSRVMDQTFESVWQLKHPHNALWSDKYLNLWKHQKRNSRLVN
ncbi:MAG: hypothetical protein PSX36_10655 [bacterium]|nr:hypothetical protein [bacterium]